MTPPTGQYWDHQALHLRRNSSISEHGFLQAKGLQRRGICTARSVFDRRYHRACHQRDHGRRDRSAHELRPRRLRCHGDRHRARRRYCPRPHDRPGPTRRNHQPVVSAGRDPGRVYRVPHAAQRQMDDARAHGLGWPRVGCMVGYRNSEGSRCWLGLVAVTSVGCHDCCGWRHDP